MFTRTLALIFSASSFIGAANAQSAGGLGALGNFAPLIAIFAIMYFFMFRPQSKKAKEHREMVAALKRGDRVVVANGILGVVTKVIDDAEISVEISPNVDIKVVRASISQVISKIPAAKSLSDKPVVKKTKALKKKAAPKKTPAVKK